MLEHSKTTIDVNRSLIKTNKFTRTTNKISVCITAITGFFLCMKVFHESGSSHYKAEKSLEQNKQSLNMISKGQGNIDSTAIIPSKRLSKVK